MSTLEAYYRGRKELFEGLTIADLEQDWLEYPYLTIKDYDLRRDSYLLDFPNNEVRQGFLTMIANSYLKPKNGNIEDF